jgi:hypothetical protein
MKQISLIVLALLFVSCASKPKPEPEVLPAVGFVAPPSPARYPACGGDQKAEKLEVVGSVEFARALVGKKLVCKIGEQQSEGSLGEFAKFRCMGSPTYLLLSTYGQTREITELNENADGSAMFTTAGVSNMGLLPNENSMQQRRSEKITCVHEEAFDGDKKSVLKIADFLCAKEVMRSLWSKFVGDYHSKKRALQLAEVPGNVNFELTRESNGSYGTKNLSISGLAYPSAKGSAKVQVLPEGGCKVLSAEGKIN